TTTLRMVIGLLQPTTGQSSIAGFDSRTHSDEVKRRVGIVSASTGVYSWLTAREYLLFFADLYGVSPVQATANLQRLSHVLSMAGVLDQPGVTMSTGEKQRVQLARALMHAPPVLLLDKPTLGLDAFGSEIVLEYLAHLRRLGKAVILTTHRLDEAERLCDRFGLLHQGRLFSEGTLTELRTSSGCTTLVEMFLRLANVVPF